MMFVIHVMAGLVVGTLAGLAVNWFRTRHLWAAALLATGVLAVLSYGNSIAGTGHSREVLYGIMGILAAYVVTGVVLMTIKDRGDRSHA